MPIVPDAIVLDPLDFCRIQALKEGGTGKYLLGSPLAQLANVLWQVPLYQSLSMNQDEFLIGNLSLAATIYDRMEVEVLISSEDADNFTMNMYTICAEKRLALAIKRPSALVLGDFGNVT